MSRGGVAMAAAALTRLGVPRAAAVARRMGLWRAGELMVVLYHRVVDPADVGELDPDLIDATPADFDAQMAALAQQFRPVSIDDVLAAHRAGRPVPAGSVLVTFDDGYRDNFEHAFPILKRHGIPGLFFISTGHVDGRRLFWWEQLSLFVRRSPLDRAVLAYPRPRQLDLSSPAASVLSTRCVCVCDPMPMPAPRIWRTWFQVISTRSAISVASASVQGTWHASATWRTKRSTSSP